MNAYKKKICRSSLTDAANDDLQELTTWYSQVLESADLRDRVAVTCGGISRGTFGQICLDANIAKTNDIDGALDP